MSVSAPLKGVYYGPDESATDIFLERGFIAGGFLGGVGYGKLYDAIQNQWLKKSTGIQFTLYLSCAMFLWNDRRARSGRFIFLLVYITVLIIIATIFAAVQARTTEETYVDNRNFPGGPWQYFLSTEYLPINVMFYATFIAGTFLADLLMVGDDVLQASQHVGLIGSFSFGDAGLFSALLVFSGPIPSLSSRH